MGAFSMARKSLQTIAAKHGYQIERKYELGKHRLDILELLVSHSQPDDPDFFFVQIGANDGKTNDPINRMIRRYNWRGILLEPQPDAFRLLLKNYEENERLIFENAALAMKDGKMAFWTVPGQTGLGSFSKQVLRRSVFDAQMKETTVATISSTTLLKKHRVERIDLLQIDTEGFDFEIIKMFLEPGILPAIINYEHLHLSTPDREACVNFLGALDYKMLQAGPERIDTIAYRAHGQ